MPTAVDVIDIPEALASVLAAEFPTRNVLTTLDTNYWRKHLPDAGRIIVCPNDEASQVGPAITVSGYTLAIDITIQIPLPTGKTDNRDDLRDALELRQAIQALWDEDGELRDATICNADWVGFSKRSIWEPRDVNGAQQFTSILTPIYRFER